jgi:hypothetical protein
MGRWERRGGGAGPAESDPGRVLAIVEQPTILVLPTTQATSLVSTTRRTVEQEIKRGNLTAKKAGDTWVIDDAETER